MRKRKETQYQQVSWGSQGGSAVANYRGGMGRKKKGTSLKGGQRQLPTFVCTFLIDSKGLEKDHCLQFLQLEIGDWKGLSRNRVNFSDETLH